MARDWEAEFGALAGEAAAVEAELREAVAIPRRAFAQPIQQLKELESFVAAYTRWTKSASAMDQFLSDLFAVKTRGTCS